MCYRDFPGGPAVRTLCFQCRVSGLIPGTPWASGWARPWPLSSRTPSNALYWFLRTLRRLGSAHGRVPLSPVCRRKDSKSTRTDPVRSGARGGGLAEGDEEPRVAGGGRRGLRDEGRRRSLQDKPGRSPLLPSHGWAHPGSRRLKVRAGLLETVVLEKTLESPLDCKEIQPVHLKGDQPWVFIGPSPVHHGRQR